VTAFVLNRCRAVHISPIARRETTPIHIGCPFLSDPIDEVCRFQL